MSGIGGEPPLPFLSLSSAAAAVFKLGSDLDMEEFSVSILISCTRGRSLGDSENRGNNVNTSRVENPPNFRGGFLQRSAKTKSRLIRRL